MGPQTGDVIEVDTGCAVRALFTTRAGGVSGGPYESLNLSSDVGDDPAAVERNRAGLAALAGLDPGRLVSLRQVHGADVVHLERAPAERPCADAAVADAAGLGLMVMAADCVPLLLWRLDGSRVGVAHAGWRGLVDGVIEAAVDALGVHGEEVGVAVGPAIGACCYEVSEDILDRFRARFGPAVLRGTHVDLPGAAVAALLGAGVDPGAVSVVDRCTRCSPGALFSYRGAGGLTGRQCGMVWR